MAGCGLQRVVASQPMGVHRSVSDVSTDSLEMPQAVKSVRATSHAGSAHVLLLTRNLTTVTRRAFKSIDIVAEKNYFGFAN